MQGMFDNMHLYRMKTKHKIDEENLKLTLKDNNSKKMQHHSGHSLLEHIQIPVTKGEGAHCSPLIYLRVWTG